MAKSTKKNYKSSSKGKLKPVVKKMGVNVSELTYSERKEYIEEKYAPFIVDAQMIFSIWDSGIEYDYKGDRKEVVQSIIDSYKDLADYTESTLPQETIYEIQDWDLIRRDIDPDTDEVIGETSLKELSADNTYNFSYNGLVDLNWRVYHDDDYDRYFYVIMPHLGGDIRGNYGDAIILEGNDKDDLFYRFYEGFISGGASVYFKFKDGSEIGFDSEQDSDVFYFRVNEVSEPTGMAKTYLEDFEKFESWQGDEFLEETIDIYLARKGVAPKMMAGGKLNDETPMAYIQILGYDEGKWFNLTDYSDGQDVIDAIADLMNQLNKELGGNREEFEVTDYEGFGDDLYDEYMGANEFDEIIEAYEKYQNSDFPSDVISAYKNNSGSRNDSLSDIIDEMDNNYFGKYDNLSDFGYEMVEQGVYEPSDSDVYITDTDKRLIAGEESDNLVDNMSFDELLNVATDTKSEYEDEKSELEDKIVEITDEINDLIALQNDNTEDDDEYERISDEIEAKEIELEDVQNDLDDIESRFEDKAREEARELFYDEIHDRLENDLEGWLEEYGYTDDLQNINFLSVDYEKIGDDLSTDYLIVEYDGNMYFFNNYAKGGRLVASKRKPKYDFYIVESSTKKLVSGYPTKAEAVEQRKLLVKEYPSMRFEIFTLGNLEAKTDLDVYAKKDYVELSTLDKIKKVSVDAYRYGQEKVGQAQVFLEKNDVKGKIKRGARKVWDKTKQGGNWLKRQWQEADFGDGKGKAKFFADGGNVIEKKERVIAYNKGGETTGLVTDEQVKDLSFKITIKELERKEGVLLHEIVTIENFDALGEENVKLPPFHLIYGNSSLAIFDAFGLDEVAGLKRADAVEKINSLKAEGKTERDGSFIAGLTNFAGDKLFMFFNVERLTFEGFANRVLPHEALHLARTLISIYKNEWLQENVGKPNWWANEKAVYVDMNDSNEEFFAETLERTSAVAMDGWFRVTGQKCSVPNKKEVIEFADGGMAQMGEVSGMLPNPLPMSTITPMANGGSVQYEINNLDNRINNLEELVVVMNEDDKPEMYATISKLKQDRQYLMNKGNNPQEIKERKSFFSFFKKGGLVNLPKDNSRVHFTDDQNKEYDGIFVAEGNGNPSMFLVGFGEGSSDFRFVMEVIDWHYLDDNDNDDSHTKPKHEASETAEQEKSEHDYDVYDNKRMLENQANEIEHHSEELNEQVSKTKKVPAWLVAKMERATTDLSDITHYLDGENKMANGGKVGEFKYEVVPYSNKFIVAKVTYLFSKQHEDYIYPSKDFIYGFDGKFLEFDDIKSAQNFINNIEPKYPYGIPKANVGMLLMASQLMQQQQQQKQQQPQVVYYVPQPVAQSEENTGIKQDIPEMEDGGELNNALINDFCITNLIELANELQPVKYFVTDRFNESDFESKKYNGRLMIVFKEPVSVNVIESISKFIERAEDCHHIFEQSVNVSGSEPTGLSINLLSDKFSDTEFKRGGKVYDYSPKKINLDKTKKIRTILGDYNIGLITNDFVYFVNPNEGDENAQTIMYDKNGNLISDNIFATNDLLETLETQDTFEFIHPDMEAYRQEIINGN
jgi:hypothetical protein